MNKIQCFFLTATFLFLISLTGVCFAADDNNINIGQIDIAAKGARSEAAKRAYAKIKSIYDDPRKLRMNGNLEKAVKTTRDAYLTYLTETEAIYRSQNVSATQVLNDLENLRYIWKIANSFNFELYGRSFIDLELLNARHTVVSFAGDILAKAGVKVADVPIFKQDEFCVAAALKVCEGEARRLKENKSSVEDILSKEIELMIYYSALGYGKEAATLGEKILPQAKKIFSGDREKILSVMSVLGEEYAVQGKFADSEKMMNERISYIAQNPIDAKTDERDTLAAQNDLIQIYLMQDKHLEGIRLLNDILPTAYSLPDTDRLKGLILLTTGVTMDSQGLYDKADKLLASMSKNNDILVESIRARSDINRNKIYYGLALGNDLILTMNDSTAWGINHHAALYGLCNVSDDYLKTGNITQAISVAKIAERLSLERYGKSHPSAIRAKMTLANAYRQNGEIENAFKLDLEAQKASQTLYGKDAAQTLKSGFSLAADYAAMGKTAEAQKLYEDNIIEYRQKYGASDTELPWKAMNRFAALLLEKGNWSEALKLSNYIQTSKRTFQAQLSPEDAITLLNIARAYKMAGNLEMAAKYYDKTLSSYENVRRHAVLTDEYLSGWFSGVAPVYKEQISTYLESKKPADEILKLSDMCKARNLADRYNEYLALERSDVSDTDKATAKSFASKMSRINDALNGAEQDGNDALSLSLAAAKLWTLVDENTFKANLTKKYPTYKKMREISLANEYVFSDKLNYIPTNAYFIDYCVIPNKILITVAKKGEVIATRFVDADENFLRQCEVYRELLSVPNLKAFQKKYGYLCKLRDNNYVVSPTMQEDATVMENSEFNAACETLAKNLGDALLSPLAEFIPPNAKDLIISPDAALNNIPFETLLYKNGMLIESADISYAPSLSVFCLMNKRNHAPKNIRKELLAVGGVDYGRYAAKDDKALGFPLSKGNDRSMVIAEMGNIKWNLLPGAAKEIQNVTALFSGKTDILKGTNASERALKEMDKRGELQNYRYILFSTHGLYVPPQPELSAILLRPDDTPINGRYEYNGYVTVGEWMGYHLNSDLVYLSACESGLGKFQAGEGVVGIPYGLTVAGNKSVVMSLWNIGDMFAADFTTEFFKKLSKGKNPKKALNETKREFMTDKRYVDPSIWSAFLLYGE